jgi:hypothetical protein
MLSQGQLGKEGRSEIRLSGDDGPNPQQTGTSIMCAARGR